jgi:hypothetical protein
MEEKKKAAGCYQQKYDLLFLFTDFLVFVCALQFKRAAAYRFSCGATRRLLNGYEKYPKIDVGVGLAMVRFGPDFSSRKT